jgi:predicted Rossmann fold nucleotide-binding protein DprA/Smf involved in DNA uptake
MGKMKELFIQQMNENPNMSDAEYQDWLHSQGYKPVTQEEKQSQHNDWWNSLTDKQKQQLYNDQEEAFKLTIEEMNHERE